MKGGRGCVINILCFFNQYATAELGILHFLSFLEASPKTKREEEVSAVTEQSSKACKGFHGKKKREAANIY